MTQQEKSEQAFLEAYMKEIDGPIRCEVDPALLEKLEKQQVPVRRTSTIYKIIKRSNKTSQDVYEAEASKFLKKIVFSIYRVKPDTGMTDVLLKVLKDYENIDKLICSVCQISPYDLNEYIQGKRYPYLENPIRMFFSRSHYDEFIRIQAFDQEVKQYFANESIKENKPSEDEMYEDLKIQVLMYFLKLRNAEKSITFDELIDTLKDTDNWQIAKRFSGRWSHGPVYRVMSELIGRKFIGDEGVRHIVAPLVAKTFGIALTY